MHFFIDSLSSPRYSSIIETTGANQADTNQPSRTALDATRQGSKGRFRQFMKRSIDTTLSGLNMCLKKFTGS